MNGVGGLTPAMLVASSIEELAGPASGRDEDLTDRWRLVGVRVRDGLEDRPRARSAERPRCPV